MIIQNGYIQSFIFDVLNMNEICGIYKITNLINGKCYIGQSVNISSRWKQHTQSLDKIENPDGENPLRRAFLKYGLTQQVSSPGVYGNFKFEVLMECSRDNLTKNEYAKIDELQPEYNRMMCPPSADRMWPRKQNFGKCCYVQYHNFNALGYLPFENAFFEGMVSDSGVTVSKKRDCLKLKGERVYLIVGMKQRGHRQKDFYLWCYTQVEEIEAFENENYGVHGTDFICKKPIRLNDLPGFEHFAKHTMGSFAYGLQNAINDPFSQVLMNDKLYASMEKYNQKALRWLADFEDGLEDSDLWLTNKDGRNHPSWFIFEMEPNTSTAYLRVRAISLLWNKKFFIEQFKIFCKRFPEVQTLCIPVAENDEPTDEIAYKAYDIAKKFSNLKVQFYIP